MSSCEVQFVSASIFPDSIGHLGVLIRSLPRAKYFTFSFTYSLVDTSRHQPALASGFDTRRTLTLTLTLPLVQP